MNYSGLEEMAQAEQGKQQQFACRILCCAGTPCLASGGDSVKQAFNSAIKETGLKAEIQAVGTGCMGPCSRGPLVMVQTPGRDDVIYENVSVENAQSIFAQHASAADNSQPTEAQSSEAQSSEAQSSETRPTVLPSSSPFFAKQQKIVLSNSGRIDPERLEDAVAHGGYQGLARTLDEMTPEEVCGAIVASGLRGRGGAGFPTGLKWEMVRKAHAGEGGRKYIIANGDEGDPGAYMDRTLMESDPHRVLEGMAIAGYAVGAEQGFVYVRGEYPIAAKRMERAIRMAERRGLLGSRILDTNFNFRVDVRIGAGAFVCGEETALMASVMGHRGQPVPRPPYPATSGLWGQPTLINNVETLGSIAPIIRNGAAWFASIGTEKSKGTKVFALAGKVQNTGLIEVPMGTPLREIVFDIGGGIPDGGTFKAAQTGGPSGGCIPEEYLDTPVDYESLKELGSIMGSGGLIVMDDRSCMPDVAKFFMDFCADESCGKCVPCRVGTVQMHRILERITNGSATEDDLAILESLCPMVSETSLCGLGQSAPNPVVSTLRYFRDEYEAHIKENRCSAGVCKMDQLPVMDLILA